MNTLTFHKARKVSPYPAVLIAGVVALVSLSACGPVHLVATSSIPQPLIVKMPVGVALFVPTEFSQYVHKEERTGTKWNIDIGKAQTETITQLMSAMFERVIPVESVNAGTTHANEIRAILEPNVEEFAFVTPRDAGSPFFAVSIKYRVNVYSPDGKLADSWGFTGYGTSPSQGVIMEDPLVQATALAMRDAGAKLAVEFREQPMVKGLLPETAAEQAEQSAAAEATKVAAPQVEATPANTPTQGSSEPPSPPPAAPASNVPQVSPPAESSGSSEPKP